MSVATFAAQATSQVPMTWMQIVLLWTSFGLIAAATILPRFIGNVSIERPLYWLGWAMGSVGVCAAAISRDGLKSCLFAFVGLMFFGAFVAIRFTPYLELGDWTFASNRARRRGDATGDTTRATGDATRARPRGAMTAKGASSTVFGKPPLGRRGYDPQPVDVMVERVAQRLEHRTPLTADDVRGAEFTRAFPGRGYSTDEVDAFLQDASAAISRLEKKRR